VDISNLSNGLPSTKNNIIFLFDVNKPFLENVDATTFKTFRNLMVKISEAGLGALWLTRPSQIKCADPRWGQTIGSARTIRSELDIPLATCEVDATNSDTWELASKVFSKFQSQIGGVRAKLEQEYAIVDGQVHIPRLYPVMVKEEVCRQAARYEKNVSHDLKVGTYGRLSTMKWISRPEHDLTGDEVMVEAKAVGLNFKVRRQTPTRSVY